LRHIAIALQIVLNGDHAVNAQRYLPSPINIRWIGHSAR
jgi:hypothetical protein